MSERGLGSVYRPKYRDKQTGKTKQSGVWWLKYSLHGRRYRESSHTTNRPQAVRLLKKRIAEMDKGRIVGPKVEKTTFEDLVNLIRTDYIANKRRSANRLEGSLRHLESRFALTRAINIGPTRIAEYIRERLKEEAANATINRELSALKRMFRLGKEGGLVAEAPPISLLREDNARKGFFEREQLEGILVLLPFHWRPVVRTAYITGWRMRAEILTRKWEHVDLNAGWLRLDPGETKNGDGRMFPLVPDLRRVLELQRELTSQLERETDQIVPWVFHRNGVPLKDMRTAWKTATKKAGLAGRVPHDFRRTAIRNLNRAGVPRSDAMAMVGHRTEAVYRRYSISDEQSLRESGEKLAALHENELQNETKIVPLQKRAK